MEATRLYTPQDGIALVQVLLSMGIQAELIGSLGKGMSSTHDIDILISKEDCLRIHECLSPVEEVIATDWGGLYFRNSPYGDVDVFFEYPEE